MSGGGGLGVVVDDISLKLMIKQFLTFNYIAWNCEGRKK